MSFSLPSVSPSLKTGRNQNPKPGDLIKIYRDGYQHWGVYVGEDASVVHFVNDGRVLKEKLWNVVGKDDWTVDNSLDRKYKPRDVNVIVKEANAMVGKKLRYNVAAYNCEHFANEMRYGKAESRQVQEATLLATIAMAGSAAVKTCMELNKPY